MVEKKNTSREVVKVIEKVFQENNPNIFVAGTVGSNHLTEIHGDIDVFVILCEHPEPPEELAFKHKEIIRIFRSVTRELKRKSITASVFTEFRMEEFSRYVCKMRMSENSTLIHLKVYPTPLSIKYWQVNPVAKGYFENVVTVFYEREGAQKKLRNMVDRFPDPSLTMRIEFLRSLAYETLECLMLSDLPSEFLVYEGFNKLFYIVKYVSIELLNQKEYSKKARMTWDDVHLSRFQLPSVMNRFIEFCSQHKDANRLNFSVEDLVCYFEQIISIIEKQFVVNKR
jgi:hypothetical protein